MRKLACVVAALGMMMGLASALVAQELQEGKWTMTFSFANGNTSIWTLDVKRIPDPHDRWRLGTGPLVTFTVTQGQRVLPVDVRLDGEKLAYFAEGARPVDRCSMTRQKDGRYAGECVGPEGGRASITMLPRAK